MSNRMLGWMILGIALIMTFLYFLVFWVGIFSKHSS